jgi:NAD(P)H-dependent FMN reductase
MNKVTLLCGSRKPAPGVDRPSSSRELLRAVVAGIEDAGAEHTSLDLRDLDLPQFDGRNPGQYECADLDLVRKSIDATDVLVISVPAYWGCASGPLINLFNVLGGANYDHVDTGPGPLDGLVAMLVTVGADEASAYLGAAQMRGLLGFMGAWVAPREVTIGNPRRVGRISDVVRSLRELGKYAATVAIPGGQHR